MRYHIQLRVRSEDQAQPDKYFSRVVNSSNELSAINTARRSVAHELGIECFDVVPYATWREGDDVLEQG